MSYTYRLHPLAYEDYNEAYAYYEDKQKNLSERFLKAVRNKIEKIASNPKAYGHKTINLLKKQRLNFFHI